MTTNPSGSRNAVAVSDRISPLDALRRVAALAAVVVYYYKKQ